jgi:hypothetical protein
MLCGSNYLKSIQTDVKHKRKCVDARVVVYTSGQEAEAGGL